jgi:hypothetical protein
MMNTQKYQTEQDDIQHELLPQRVPQYEGALNLQYYMLEHCSPNSKGLFLGHLRKESTHHQGQH